MRKTTFPSWLCDRLYKKGNGGGAQLANHCTNTRCDRWASDQMDKSVKSYRVAVSAALGRSSVKKPVISKKFIENQKVWQNHRGRRRPNHKAGPYSVSLSLEVLELDDLDAAELEDDRELLLAFSFDLASFWSLSLSLVGLIPAVSFSESSPIASKLTFWYYKYF